MESKSRAEIALGHVCANSQYSDLPDLIGHALRADDLDDLDPMQRAIREYMERLATEHGFALADLPELEDFAASARLWVEHLASGSVLIDRSVSVVLSEADRQKLSGLSIVPCMFDARNALAVYERRDDSYAIGIDPGVVNDVVRVFQGLIMLSEQSPDGFDSTSEPFRKWLGLILAVISSGDRESSLPSMGEGAFGWLSGMFPDSDNVRFVSSQFRETVVRFIIGHEIGHIVLGHFSRDSASGRFSIGSSSVDVHLSCFQHDLEFEADRWSAYALPAGQAEDGDQRELDDLFIRRSPGLYFLLLELLSLFKMSSTEIGRFVSDTHPSPTDRADALDIQLDDMIQCPASLRPSDLWLGELEAYLRSLTPWLADKLEGDIGWATKYVGRR